MLGHVKCIPAYTVAFSIRGVSAPFNLFCLSRFSSTDIFGPPYSGLEQWAGLGWADTLLAGGGGCSDP